MIWSGRVWEAVDPLVVEPRSGAWTPAPFVVGPGQSHGPSSPHQQGWDDKMLRDNAGVSVGVDVSLDFLDVHIVPTGSRVRVEYSHAGLDHVISQLGGLDVDRVVLEATGRVEAFAVSTLAAAGLPVVVVNPRQVRDFARASGRLAKTDTIDAEMIARFGEAMEPPVRPLPTETEQRLSELLARRRQLVEMSAAEKNRMYRTGDPSVRAFIGEHLQWLRQQTCLVDDALEESIRSSPAWMEKDELLQSVPGIGQAVSYTLLAGLPELGSLDKKSVASLAGLAPVNHDSGTMRGRRSIRGGREPVRRALYMAVFSGIRCNPVVREHYLSLKDRGKPPKVAMVACMRKLLVILNAMAASGRKWQDQPPTA